MKYITRFFWICSGSSLTLIKRYPTEGSKYAGIGATIFFTGIFAALSATYAFHTVFDNWYFAIASGLVWGLMIFNLDRYIVSSMRKRDKKSTEWLMATPRIILAILIAMVISKPLELKIFEKEVENELVLMEQELRKSQEESVANRFNRQMLNLQSDIDNLKSEVTEKELVRDQLAEEAIKEADGTGGTMIRSAGPIYRLKKAEADRAEVELVELRNYNDSLIAINQVSIDSISTRMKSEIIGLEVKSYDGFAARMDAMTRITQRSATIALAHWFIILLFIAIECAPIFVKLISLKGPYDDRLQVHEHKAHTLRTEQMAFDNEVVKKKTARLKEQEKEWVQEELGKSLR